MEQRILNQKIERGTQAFYRYNKEACRFHNWLGRMYAYLRKGRKVYPEPKKWEQEQYKETIKKLRKGELLRNIDPEFTKKKT